jgi:ferredoxin
MPEKYAIHTHPTPHRFETVTKSGVIAWEEGCLKCAVCVKKECVYGVYDNRALDTYQMVDSIDNQCMNCFRCVQNCPKELIHKSINPEFKALGDTHWTPDIIARLWYQSETGKIPVSGAGYPGPYSGPGFDSMWTDMSEIVRPTRDGIHGREYISTAVDIGRTPRNLLFSDDGFLEGESPQVADVPLPILMRVPGFGSLSEDTLRGWALGARRLGTLLALPEKRLKKDLDEFQANLIPVLSSGPMDLSAKDTPLVEVAWTEDWEKRMETVQKSQPSALVIISVPLEKGVEERVVSLARSGVSIVHLEGSYKSRMVDDASRFLKDGIRSVHRTLVDECLRDGVTLLASGGISMAEHVAKSIICGADAVYVDFPILIALECRMCRRCTKGLSCPVKIEEAEPVWIASRIVNLMGAWHNQLLEVMGAMGIRDARRLRGETGRAMFFEELDMNTFGSVAEMKEGYDLE